MGQTNTTQLVVWTDRTGQDNCPQAIPPKVRTRLTYLTWVEYSNAYQPAERPHLRHCQSVSPTDVGPTWGMLIIINNTPSRGTMVIPRTVPVMTLDIHLYAPQDHSNLHPTLGHKHLQGFEEPPVVDYAVFRHLWDFSETQPSLVTWGKSPEG